MKLINSFHQEMHKDDKEEETNLLVVTKNLTIQVNDYEEGSLDDRYDEETFDKVHNESNSHHNHENDENNQRSNIDEHYDERNRHSNLNDRHNDDDRRNNSNHRFEDDSYENDDNSDDRMNSDHRRHRDFDQDNDRHEDHHSKIGKDATILWRSCCYWSCWSKSIT